MMWIVRLALRRPYTFAVFALLIVILGAYSIVSMPTDIFPDIDIPVVTVVWNYTGLSAQEMSTRIVFNSERGMTTTVSDIEHIESQSLNGVAIIKIFFQPHVDIGERRRTGDGDLPGAASSTSAWHQSAVHHPVQRIQRARPACSAFQETASTSSSYSISAPTPFAPSSLRSRAHKLRFRTAASSVRFKLTSTSPSLQAKGLSPADVVNAISAQNLIVPSGTMKIDRFEYAIETNSSPSIVDQLNNLPIRSINGAVVYVRDVAHVRDGNPPQTNIVRVDGQRASHDEHHEDRFGLYSQDHSRCARRRSTSIKGQLPPELRINPLSDQSIFVRGAINGVVREAMVAACLTAVMILIFLGSWRSTLIIAVSIPLSILCSLTMLAVLHETINIMTLGGLALAVGILVDDATVEIENINRNLESGKEIEQAILDGAAQIATPALVSTLSICIVFVPMFLLSGVARYLFVPLAEAVVFAMLASYLLSRTVVPTMAKYLLHEHDDAAVARKGTQPQPIRPLSKRVRVWV